MKWFIVGWLALFANAAFSEESKVVCAEYIKTGSKYKVNASFVRGSDLNVATRSHNYESTAKYVVIFWDKGEATIIDMGSSWPGYRAETGQDQQGREWEVSTNTTFCR